MFAAVRLGVGSARVCVIVNIVQGLQNLTAYAQWVHSSLMTCHLGHHVWLFFIALSIFAPLIASSSFCRGFISLGERSYVLEPCADRSDGTHWIYTAEHLNFAPGTCGHDFNTTYSSAHTDGSPFKAFSTRVRIIKHIFFLQLVNSQYVVCDFIFIQQRYTLRLGHGLNFRSLAFQPVFFLSFPNKSDRKIRQSREKVLAFSLLCSLNI